MTRVLTADTSVVIPALASWHESHAVAAAAVAEVDQLPAHVFLESLSVLTRLPGGVALTMRVAVDELRASFPGSPLVLTAHDYDEALTTLAIADVTGGQVYDALIAMTARAADATLLTLDRRAERTYSAIGATIERVV